MSQPSTIATKELPCPHCGYDLRAMVDSRCPECGNPITGSLTTSHIPWVHRKQRGRIRAYVQTIWMLYRRPNLLARETIIGIEPHDARAFRHISWLLATGLSTVLMMITFACRGAQWAGELSSHTDFSREAPAPLSFPAYVLTDSCWIAIPLTLSSALALSVTMQFHRWALRLLSGNKPHRKQVQRAGDYASGLFPVTWTALGTLSILGMVLYEEHPWLTGTGETIAQTLTAILGLSAALAFYWPTFALVLKTGRWIILRILLMLLVFPYAVVVIYAVIGLILFWSTGYVLIAVRSMLV